MSRPLKVASLLLLSLLLLTNCRRPHNVLNREQMKAVTEDLLLVEAMNQYQYLSDSALALYYESVFAEHGISRATYDSSLVWYGKNAPLLADIYQEIGGSFQEKRNLADSAFVDSTQWVRVRYEPTTSAWQDELQRIYIDGHKPFALLTSQELRPQLLDLDWGANDTLLWCANILPPLSEGEQIALYLYIKNEAGHVVEKLSSPLTQEGLQYTTQILLPDSLPNNAHYLIHLIYLAEPSKASSHLLQNISFLSLKNSSQATESESSTEALPQHEVLTDKENIAHEAEVTRL